MVLLLSAPGALYRSASGHARDGEIEEEQAEKAQENDQRERVEREVALAGPGDPEVDRGDQVSISPSRAAASAIQGTQV